MGKDCLLRVFVLGLTGISALAMAVAIISPTAAETFGQLLAWLLKAMAKLLWLPILLLGWVYRTHLRQRLLKTPGPGSGPPV